MSDLISPKHLSSASSTSTVRFSFWHRFEKPLTSAIATLAISLMAGALPYLQVNAAESSDLLKGVAQSQPPSATAVNTTVAHAPLPNGTYLFGHSREAQQLGSTYLVFEAVDNQIVGAFYLPQSSFDCVYGEPQAEQLALTVVNSEDKTQYSYSVGMRPAAEIATTGGRSAIAPLQLAGYHQIDAVSDTDRRILATCRAARPQ